MVFLIASPSAKRLLCHLLELERSREGKAGCLGKEQSKELFIRSDLSVFHAADLVRRSGTKPNSCGLPAGNSSVFLR